MPEVNIQKEHTEKKNIHEGHRQRLKETILNDPDMKSLSDFEILEYILTFVIPRKDTNPIAHALIDHFGSLYYVFMANYNSLVQVSGVTKNAAHLISNFFPLMRRIYSAKEKRDIRVSNLDDAVSVLAPYFAARETERIYMACMDVHEKLINVELISTGEAANASLDISQVLRMALKYNPFSVVLAHNHPAGDLHPSDNDIVATKAIGNAFSSLGIYLSDHIIFTNEGYLSFYMAGLMPLSPLGYNFDNGVYFYNEKRKASCSSYFRIRR